MWFPQNPKVLIVDDHYDEVEPLFRLFSKNGIPYVYFDGKKRSHPNTPFTSIRLVILDINLEPITHGLDEKSKASALATYLSKLIDIKEIPYAILFWTKHEDIIAHVIKYLKDSDGTPIIYKNMEKPTKEELKKISLSKLEQRFLSNLDNESFDFLINWEGSLQKDISKYVNLISTIAKNETSEKINWDFSIKNILLKLAYSYTGSTTKLNNCNNAQILSYATKVLNTGIAESLSNKIATSKALDFPQKPRELNLTTIARLNSLLFFEDPVISRNIENGKICPANNNVLFELLKTDKTIKKFLVYGEPKLISIVLTPSCDISHQKNLKKSTKEDKIEFEIHRMLYGIQISIFKKNYSDNNFLQLLDESTPDSIYLIKPFYREEALHIILFHFGTISSKKTKPNKKFNMMLKKNLTFDLQTKLANHVNRLGNSMLGYKK